MNIQTHSSLCLPATSWEARFKFEQQVRDYFLSQHFIEVRTPLLVKSPGMEPDILPIKIQSQPVFLPTSPEFGMKKLLASTHSQAGSTKIFQICSTFRDEPESPEHQPEFTMLEFYETHISLAHLQNRIEDLFTSLARGNPKIPFRNLILHLERPWKRFTIRELFLKYCMIDLRGATLETLLSFCEKNTVPIPQNPTWDDLYFLIWLNEIESKLPKDIPFFITDYPLHQSSLCNAIADETGFLWANRFEVFMGGMELGNAFDELRDVKLQRKNFESDQKKRRERYQGQWPESPMDEDFLEAVSKMPPTCGIALGLDRMAMIFLNQAQIQDVVPLKPFWPKATT